MPQCQAFNCKNKGGCGKSFFPIPDPLKSKEHRKLCKKWIESLHNKKLNLQTFKANRQKMVCEDHFTDDCFEGAYTSKVAKSLNFKCKRKGLVFGSIPTIVNVKNVSSSKETIKKRPSIENIRMKRLKAQLMEELNILKQKRCNSKHASVNKETVLEDQFGQRLEIETSCTPKYASVNKDTVVEDHLGQRLEIETPCTSEYASVNKETVLEDQFGQRLEIETPCTSKYASVNKETVLEDQLGQRLEIPALKQKLHGHHTQDNVKSPSQGQAGNYFSVSNMHRNFVNIGSVTSKWMKIKSKKRCKSDEDLARLLIRSFQKHDNQGHFRSHSFRRKRSRKPILGGHRIIILQNDVWMQWQEIKCSLQVRSNSHLADMFIKAWHGRDTYTQKLNDTMKAGQQNPISKVQEVGTYIKRNFADHNAVNHAPIIKKEVPAVINQAPVCLDATVNAASIIVDAACVNGTSNGLTPSHLKIISDPINGTLGDLKVTFASINVAPACMKVSSALMKVSPALINVIPSHVNVTSAPLHVARACIKKSSPLMNVTPTGINVTPALKNVTPIPMYVTPAFNPKNMTYVPMNLTPFPKNKTPSTIIVSPAPKSVAPVGTTVTPILKYVTPVSVSVTPFPNSVTPALKDLTPNLINVTPFPNIVTPAPKDVTPNLMNVTPFPNILTPAPKDVTPNLMNVTPVNKSVNPAHMKMTPAPKTVTPLSNNVTVSPVTLASKGVTRVPMNVTPLYMNVTPVHKSVTHASQNETPVSNNVSLSPVKVTFASKNVIPVSMNETPVPVNVTPAPINVTLAPVNVTPDCLDNIPALMSLPIVMEEIKPDLSGNISSTTQSKVQTDFKYPDVKEGCVSEESGADLSSDSDIDDIINYVQTEKKMIKITEDPTENSSEVGNRRKSARVQSRGYRPNYANLDWLDHNEENNDGNVPNYQVSNKILQTDVKQKCYSSSNEMMIDKSEFMDGFVQKKGNKRKKEEDPDFVLSDIDSGKDQDDQTVDEESSTQKDLDDFSADSKLSIKEKILKVRYNKRLRKQTNGVCNKIEKRPKKKKRADKKPWVHIKLAEHQDKYNIEVVGSFARKDRKVDLSQELFKCLVCGLFKSAAKDIFEAHIEQHVNKVLECDQCTYIGSSEYEIVKHKATSGHLSGRHTVFMCDICGQVLYTNDRRRSHMGREHNVPLFACRFCDEKFVTRKMCRFHQRTKHFDYVKYCFKCDTDYSSLSAEDFKDHQNSCRVVHQCQICGVILAKKSSLNCHIKTIHMNVRRFQCSTCQYAAKSAQKLRDHELTHKSVHPYSCDQCTFTCVQKYQLTSHMRTHSGEKPYKCSQCKFAAAWNVQLKEHIKVHSMENTVQCLQCDIVFRNEKALKLHKKKDHPLLLT